MYEMPSNETHRIVASAPPAPKGWGVAPTADPRTAVFNTARIPPPPGFKGWTGYAVRTTEAMG